MDSFEQNEIEPVECLNSAAGGSQSRTISACFNLEGVRQATAGRHLGLLGRLGLLVGLGLSLHPTQPRAFLYKALPGRCSASFWTPFSFGLDC